MSAEVVQLQTTPQAPAIPNERDEQYDLQKLKAYAKKNRIRISIHANDEENETSEPKTPRVVPEAQATILRRTVDVPAEVKEKKPRKPSAWSGFQKQASQQIRDEGGKPTLALTNARARELADAAGHTFQAKKK